MQLNLCINATKYFKQHIKIVNLSNVYGTMWAKIFVGYLKWYSSKN